MSILQELITYANNCLNDIKVSEYEDYISCKKHKWACQRFLDDLKRSEGRNVLTEPFPYIWDEEEAQKIVDWFAMLRHSKGILAGQPIILTPSQRFDLCQLYGWRHETTGYKRFKKSFKEVARKNAKSQEEAGIALYEISVQATKNGETYEYYTAGVKRDQSKIVFNEAKLMLKGSPLRTKFKITRDLITHIKTESFIKALCKEDGQKGDGTNPAGLILDEYHQHKTSEFYDLGLGSNTKESLLMIITTAGMDLTYPCYTQEYQYCSKILNPDIDVWNDEYYVDIYELDKEDYKDISNIANERLWFKANPIRMTYKEGQEKIRGEYLIAKEIPEKMTAFLTKCLNIWVQAKENGYMDMAKWKKCQVKEIPINTKGMSVYVGFDMSAKIDLTSVAFIIPWKTDKVDKFGKPIIKYIVYSHSFIPNREKLQERKLKDKVDYDAWERMGFLTVTDTEIVDQNAVMDYVLKTCEKMDWHIETLCFDPANASKIMMDLSNEGYDVEEVYQSHKSLNESTAGFREQVYCGNVLYLYNPLLNFAMSNAVIKTNNGLIKIDKDATTKRIDPVDATLCAFKLALYHEFTSSINDVVDKFLDTF
ncbi:terminase large subunit [Anaerocolumna aminovalerica]|uniref:terminase large subunit n=1 Tax=Anaerocolumna aminovalerica TaxID=1527 RepID=UPI001C0E9FBB|nr:terminase large subunit [Anaerocolumna aminovalerica]